MRTGRRTFLRGAVASLGSMPLVSAASAAGGNGPIRAVAFDAFVIFDSRTIYRRAREILGEDGAAFAASWLQKLFGDTWLLTAAGRYLSIEAVAAASLETVADTRAISLSPDTKAKLIGSFARLDVWPDVLPALSKLRSAGVQLCILSNLSDGLLHSNLRRSMLTDWFDAVLSTDRVRQFKPAPSAYALAPHALGIPLTNIGFAAFGGWDAVGATWFGYRTAWVNRSGAPSERLDAAPQITSAGIDGVLRLAGVG